MQELNEQQLDTLRVAGIISANEIAYKSGDLIVAEDVVSKTRRVLEGAHNIIAESNKRILKG